MKQYSAAIFDLDGTLLNTVDDLADSVNHALAKAGYPLRTIAKITAFVGDGVEMLIRRAVPDGTSDEDVRLTLADFSRHYGENMENKTAPYPGVPDMLRQLKALGIPVSIASNKFQAGVAQLAEKYFTGLYTAALGERADVPRKPDSAIIFAALGAMGASVDDALYIGDSDVDAATAKNAGVDFVGVGWGLRDAELLRRCGAICVVDEADELLRFFK